MKLFKLQPSISSLEFYELSKISKKYKKNIYVQWCSIACPSTLYIVEEQSWLKKMKNRPHGIILGLGPKNIAMIRYVNNFIVASLVALERQLEEVLHLYASYAHKKNLCLYMYTNFIGLVVSSKIRGFYAHLVCSLFFTLFFILTSIDVLLSLRSYNLFILSTSSYS